jgi:hypothetical protein
VRSALFGQSVVVESAEMEDFGKIGGVGCRTTIEAALSVVILIGMERDESTGGLREHGLFRQKAVLRLMERDTRPDVTG